MTDIQVSPQRRDEIIDALRRGTVPPPGLDAVGGRAGAVRARHRGRARGRADRARDVQGRARRVRQRQDVLRPMAGGAGARAGLRHVRGPDLRDRDAAAPAGDRLPPADRAAGHGRHAPGRFPQHRSMGGSTRWKRTFWPRRATMPPTTPPCSPGPTSCMEQRLAEVTQTAPTFAACPAGLSAGRWRTGTRPSADGLLAWLAGQPNVAAGDKRPPGIKGDIDHFGALSFLQGLLIVLRDRVMPGSCWCSTRWRPSSGCAATCGTRASMPCGSSSTRWTRGDSPACIC